MENSSLLNPIFFGALCIFLIGCGADWTSDIPSDVLEIEATGGDGDSNDDSSGETELPADNPTEDTNTSPVVTITVPTIDPEPSEDCDAALQSDWYFHFLDDLCEEKRTPTKQDRDRACPVVDSTPSMALSDGSTVTYWPSSAPFSVDSSALAGIVPDDMQITVILIKRIDGVPHYRYISNGSHDEAFQPWSTTKFLAVANGASQLRSASNYEVGLTARVNDIPLGDLVTTIHSYKEDLWTSNGLGKYFHDIGGRERANQLIHGLWLDRPTTETFGGNYGDAAPNWGYHFVEDTGASIEVDPDTTAGFDNHLSSFTTAEALKRLVLHREEPAQRLPGIQWKDLRILLYGTEADNDTPAWGGMTADTAIYLQSGHDMDYIETRSNGQWTTFSKLGLGSQGQFAHVGYACYPVLDNNDAPVDGWGREFVISAHLKTGGGSWAGRDRLLARIYRKVISSILNGAL